MWTCIAAEDRAVVVLAEFFVFSASHFFHCVFTLCNDFIFFFMALYFHFCLYFGCSYIRGPHYLLHFGVLSIPDIRDYCIWNKDGLWVIAETNTKNDGFIPVWPHPSCSYEHVLSAGNVSLWTAHNSRPFKLLSPIHHMPVKVLCYLMCNSSQ